MRHCETRLHRVPLLLSHVLMCCDLWMHQVPWRSSRTFPCDSLLEKSAAAVRAKDLPCLHCPVGFIVDTRNVRGDARLAMHSMCIYVFLFFLYGVHFKCIHFVRLHVSYYVLIYTSVGNVIYIYIWWNICLRISMSAVIYFGLFYITS